MDPTYGVQDAVVTVVLVQMLTPQALCSCDSLAFQDPPLGK